MWSEWDRDRDRDCRIIGFETAEMAAEMQAWIDANEIASRPLPQYGPTKEELAALREAALKWGFTTGAVRRVVQAYRRKMLEVGEGAQAEYQAAHMVALYRPPPGEVMDIGMFLVEWAKEHHGGWFYGRRRSAGQADEGSPEKEAE